MLFFQNVKMFVLLAINKQKLEYVFSFWANATKTDFLYKNSLNLNQTSLVDTFALMKNNFF